MKNIIPTRFSNYDFTRLFVSLGFTLAIAVIIYSVLFGSIL